MSMPVYAINISPFDGTHTAEQLPEQLSLAAVL
jgi:hypothetical protein